MARQSFRRSAVGVLRRAWGPSLRPFRLPQGWRTAPSPLEGEAVQDGPERPAPQGSALTAPPQRRDSTDKGRSDGPLAGGGASRSVSEKGAAEFCRGVRGLGPL